VLNPINYTDPEITQMNEFGFDFALRTGYPISPEYGDIAVEHKV